MPKHNGDYYCLGCLHSFRTKIKLESHIKLCNSKDFCNVLISSEDTKILEFNQYCKSYKAPFFNVYNYLQYCTLFKDRKTM